MAKKDEIPEVNAGSMADIAFLLLIFFLVTTTIQTDVGLDRKLPPQDTTPPPQIQERNILRVTLNKNDELMVENDIIPIERLKSSAIAFLDNGGGTTEDKNYCTYCRGERSSDSSDNPIEAVIAFNSDREASYGMYIMVQNELMAAYNTLRNRESQRLFDRDFREIEEAYADPTITAQTKVALKESIHQIRNMFPLKLSEAEIDLNL